MSKLFELLQGTQEALTNYHGFIKHQKVILKEGRKQKLSDFLLTLETGLGAANTRGTHGTAGQKGATPSSSCCGTFHGASVRTFYFETKGSHNIPSKYICISRVN